MYVIQNARAYLFSNPAKHLAVLRHLRPAGAAEARGDLFSFFKYYFEILLFFVIFFCFGRNEVASFLFNMAFTY